MNYDREKLAIALVTKRRGMNTITMRGAAKQIGVSAMVIHKAETRKGLSNESFLKICAWLGKDPDAFKIETV